MKKNTQNIKPKYSESEINEFDDYHQFMDASVNLLKQTIELLWILIGIGYCDENGEPKEITKDEAVVAGNINRFIKLNTSFLQNICEGKIEIASILSRCIGETYVNTKYLLSNSEEKVIRNYIKYSLITEKELWNKIKENIEKRGGETKHIEFRMNESIKRSFDKSDFELDEVRRSSKWKSISKRADEVAGTEFYSIFYGISSHSIHGNWQDILTYHLTNSGNGFKLNLKWNDAQPQLIDATVLMNLDLIELLTDKFANSEIKKIKNELLDYQIGLIESHEKYLKKK
jgi:hypothetical protein